MTITLPTMQDAAILADNGPLGRHARQQAEHQLRKASAYRGPVVFLAPNGATAATVEV